MVTRNMVADFVTKVVLLAITEKLIKFIEDDSIDVHLLILGLISSKDTGSYENFTDSLSSGVY